MRYVIGAAVVLVLIAGAVYASPGLVWKRFVEKNINSEIVSSNFIFSYTDNYNPTVEPDEFLLVPRGLRFSINGTSYLDISDLNNMQTSMDADYALGSGDTSFNSRFSFVLNGENMYVYFGSNPLTGLFFTDQNQEWIKFNLKDLSKNSSSTANNLTWENLSQSQKAYQDLALRYYPKILVVKKVKGIEKLDGGFAAHFENSLEKNHAKAYLKEVVSLAMGQIQAQDEAGVKEMEEAKKTVDAIVESLVDRLEVKSFETWVYVSSKRLAKIKLETNAPSLGSMFSMQNIEKSDNGSPGSAREIMSKVSFNAIFNFEQEFKNYGVRQAVNIPTNALDFSEFLKQQEQEQSLYEEDLSGWDQTYEGQ